MLSGGQKIARRLVAFWAGTLYIHFWGCCPLREFCHMQNSLCIQVLHCPIFAALLYGTRAVGVSKTYAAWYLYATGQPSHSTLGGGSV